MSDFLIRVAVVDDHPVFREGAAVCLERAGGFEVVAHGASADDAMRIAADHRPDLILLDINMPGNGIEAARQISGAFPGVKSVILTASESEEHVAAALEAGARGYIVKGVGVADLVRTIRAVHCGESYVSPGLAARLLTQMQRKRASGKLEEAQPDLTSREEEILGHVSNGLTNKEIAKRLNISEKTVKHYMTNIMQKLQVRNRVEAVMSTRVRRAV